LKKRNFNEFIKGAWEQKKFLCVGLDLDLKKIPESVRSADMYHTLLDFNKAIIDATKTIVCAYKPNSAFYEAHTDAGWRALRDTIAYIHTVAPEVAVILDAKRADIGNTNNGYVASAFDDLGADAITVHPYMGIEALAPFLDRKDKGIIVLCRTSNPGAGEFQDVNIGGEPLYIKVARNVCEKWNTNNNCSLVVGATYPKELKAVRAVVGDMPLLIPAIGAQGGDIEATVRAGKNSRGEGMIISVSRSVIFASSQNDFANAAREEAQRFDSAIRNSL
jgi:orotidine-5'-phosphate decarboxylase